MLKSIQIKNNYTMIGIIGAGLSGLLLAYRLQQAGIPFKILEGRNRVGGRIETIKLHETAVEMGATWFAPKHEYLWQLLQELALEPYPQQVYNSFFYHQHIKAPVQSIAMPPQEPSYRITGGTSQIIQKLTDLIDHETVLLNESVEALSIEAQQVIVKTIKAEHHFEKVIWAAPPKLFTEKIKTTPAIPPELLAVMQQTHTWMEESIKLGLTYTEPFWDKQSISATLFSNEGPIIEFYDHSNREKSHFALCGFMHPAYINVPDSARKEAVNEQLFKVFGEEGIAFTNYQERLWQNEDFTGNKQKVGLVPHQNNGHIAYQQPIFDKLYFANTETSPHYGGYMEGAVYAAENVAKKLIKEVERL